MLPSPLSVCRPPPDSPVLCPPPPSSCLVVQCHTALHCLPPDCPTLSASRSSCIVHHSLLLCCLLSACLMLSPTPQPTTEPAVLVLEEDICTQCHTLPCTFFEPNKIRDFLMAFQKRCTQEQKFGKKFTFIKERERIYWVWN